MRTWMRKNGHNVAAAPLVALVLFVLVVAGCSGSASSPGSARSFAAMQVPEPSTAPILGPITGAGPRTFTITGRHLMSYQIGCLGRHVVWLHAPHIGFAVQCGDGGTYAGNSVRMPSREIGAMISIRVVAPPGTAWRLRVDGSRR